MPQQKNLAAGSIVAKKLLATSPQATVNLIHYLL